MGSAVTTSEEIRAAQSMTMEDVKSLASNQLNKAKEAWDDRQIGLSGSLGAAGAAYDYVYWRQSRTALDLAETVYAKAIKSGDKEQLITAFITARNAIDKIAEQSDQTVMTKYIVRPIDSKIIQPVKESAINAVNDIKQTAKDAASGLNATILLLGLAYIATQGVKDIALKRGK